MRSVLLTGGIYHPFDECAEVMAELLADHGVSCTITDSVDTALNALPDVQLFVNYALRWRMLNDEKYVPHRARWAYSLAPEDASRITSFVAAGGAFLAMHTASICFDTWDEYGEVLGGRWQWGTTYHPPLGPVEVEPVGIHPLVASVPPFEQLDEVYHDLALHPDCTPLLRGRIPGESWHTLAWAHQFGRGRVVYDALGHDAASLRQSAHHNFLAACVDWLLEPEKTDTSI